MKNESKKANAKLTSVIAAVLIIVVAIVAVIIFFTGVVLHVVRKQHDENFEHHLTLINQNKKR